jgi:hypothetical protein
MNDSSQSLKRSNRFILLHLFIVHLYFSNVHWTQSFCCLFIYYLRSAQEFFTYMETSILLLQRNWHIHTQLHSEESNTKWRSLNRCNFASVYHPCDSACSTLLVNWYFDSYINKRLHSFKRHLYYLTCMIITASNPPSGTRKWTRPSAHFMTSSAKISDIESPFLHR